MDSVHRLKDTDWLTTIYAETELFEQSSKMKKKKKGLLQNYQQITLSLAIIFADFAAPMKNSVTNLLLND